MKTIKQTREPKMTKNFAKGGLKAALQIIAAMGISLFPLFTMAGGSGDLGGGKGVLCGAHLEFLDLYMATSRGLQILPSTGTVKGDLKKFGAFLNKHFETDPTHPMTDAMVESYLQSNVIKLMKPINEYEGEPMPAYTNPRLALTQDATLPELPPGCQIVQIAAYDDYQKIIFLDDDYWKKLNPQNQVALIMHEALYYRARSAGAKLSDESSKTIGDIFAGNDVSILPNLPGQRLYCMGGIDGSLAETFEFSVQQTQLNGTSGLAISFYVFKSQLMTSRTSTFLPKLSIADLELLETTQVPLVLKVENSFSHQVYNFEMKHSPIATPNFVSDSPARYNDEYTIRAEFEGQFQTPQWSETHCQWDGRPF